MKTELCISITDLHQTVLDMIGSERFETNIKTCGYDNEADFKRGAIFGATQAAMFASAFAPNKNVSTCETEQDGAREIVRMIQCYCMNMTDCNECKICDAIKCSRNPDDPHSPRKYDVSSAGTSRNDIIRNTDHIEIKWEDKLLTREQIDILYDAMKSEKYPFDQKPVRSEGESFADFVAKGAKSLIEEHPDWVRQLL